MKPYQTGDYRTLVNAEYEALRRKGRSEQFAALIADQRLYELVRQHVLEELEAEKA